MNPVERVKIPAVEFERAPLRPGASAKSGKSLRALLIALLLVCAARFWLMPLGSSFWTDEIGTVFILQHGLANPSLAVVPQLQKSLYYVLPKAAAMLFGYSEAACRAPSVLAMAVALFLIARLAARLIHPRAAWFAVFACFALHGINYQAANARPYALGTCLAAASLFFLVRWLNSGGWLDALLFIGLSAMLWRVSLIFWPFYLAPALYTAVRLAQRDTPVTWVRAAGAYAILGLALVPTALDALALLRQAEAHVIVPPPSAKDFLYSLKCGLILICVGGAWLLRRAFRWVKASTPVQPASLVLILGWMLSAPLCLFVFSLLTGTSVFVQRYLAIALPGAALAATAAAAPFIPPAQWNRLALGLGTGVLLLLGGWRQLWIPHHNSDWRGAARAINSAPLDAGTPIVCPSPFIEARPPVWRPGYPIPSFLYAHLSVYPVRGRAYPFPFDRSGLADRHAATLLASALLPAGRFVIYGPWPGVPYWRAWFARQPALAAWRERSLGSFGDVSVILFEHPR